MRVRLYELGVNTQKAIFRFDRFPALLKSEDFGDAGPRAHENSHACELVDLGGQIEIRAPVGDLQVTVNDALIETAPLMPGDRLQVGKRRFLVSYERTAAERPPSIRVHHLI